MSESKNIKDFLHLATTSALLDVRTPAEFKRGHIPGAYNLPLFNDEERVIIGTIYKQQGRHAAILKGLEITGPKLSLFIREVQEKFRGNILLVHCWRGGMRSQSMSWLLELYGYKCFTLRGGYKAYRNHVLQSFDSPKRFVVLGGKTGSGKTLILQALQSFGEQIIDLEKLANHKGSSFGALGEVRQFSQEHFENELSEFYRNLDPSRHCWIENESRKIGVNIIPDKLWEQMKAAHVHVVDLPIEERICYLVREYGKYSAEELISSIERISRHLGGQHAKAAIEAIRNNDLEAACRISLVYYDKTYLYGQEQRDQKKIHILSCQKLEPLTIAAELINKIEEINPEYDRRKDPTDAI